MSYIKRMTLTVGVLWSHVAMAGWIIGNGGDGLRLQFSKAKEHAAHVVSRVSAPALAKHGAPDVVQWLAENKHKLAADILASPHEWTLEEKPTCAWTTQASHAVIEFSYPACFKQTGGFHEAASLLVHESVHHLGIDQEDFADAVAIAVYGAYKSGDIDWIGTDEAEAPTARSQHSMVWIDGKAYVFGGKLDATGAQATNTLYAYEPDKGIWQTLSSLQAPQRYKHAATSYQGKMIVWGGLSQGDGDEIVEVWHNDGAIYDPQTDRWDLIANPYGPQTFSVRIDGHAQTVVVVGDELLVWGGSVLEGRSYEAVPGAAYNLKTKRWRKIAEGGPVRRQDHVALEVDGKMLVWGGVDGNNLASAQGAIYDPALDQWKDMSSVGAPEGLDAPKAVWTGKALVIFGGYYSSRVLKGLGGQYDPVRDAWSAFETEIAFGRTGHSAIWTGQEVIIFGGWNRRLREEFGTPLAYNPEFGTWRAISSAKSPRARFDHAAVWTGNKMLIWGGASMGQVPLASGGLFYP